MLDHQLGSEGLRLVVLGKFMVLDGYVVMGRSVVLGNALLQLAQALLEESADKWPQNRGVYTTNSHSLRWSSYSSKLSPSLSLCGL